jgi:hypothetical protein
MAGQKEDYPLTLPSHYLPGYVAQRLEYLNAIALTSNHVHQPANGVYLSKPVFYSELLKNKRVVELLFLRHEHLRLAIIFSQNQLPLF